MDRGRTCVVTGFGGGFYGKNAEKWILQIGKEKPGSETGLVA